MHSRNTSENWKVLDRFSLVRVRQQPLKCDDMNKIPDQLADRVALLLLHFETCSAETVQNKTKVFHMFICSLGKHQNIINVTSAKP